MGLKKYYIDGSDVPSDDISSVMDFIQNRSYSHVWVPDKTCSYIAFWEESINPSAFPELKHCKIRELP